MHLKQTKIICTIGGGSRGEKKFIRQLFDAGMNVARLNTAHMTTEQADTVVANIRAVSERIGILIDTKGPEVRTCEMENPIEKAVGDTLRISDSQTPENGFKVNYEGFVEATPVGASILIDDGEIQLSVTDKNADELICTAVNGGTIQNRKSINVPGIKLDMPALTEQDADFISWATRAVIEYIAHSFVRSRDDVMAIQSILDTLKSPIKIIAKIENREGLDNLDSILDVAHGIMVARGDLGIEIPAQEVPIIQKHIIKTCIRRVKPVITATQMLHSMIDNPRPTRAEVSDVANAIFDGTDAVMLSGETAYGKYPIEAVQTMADIALNVEAQNAPPDSNLPVFQQEEALMPRNHLSKSAVAMAATIPAKAIVTSTKSGDTALICSSYRGRTPIYAISGSERTVRELSLSFGVYAEQIDIPETVEEFIKTSLRQLISEDYIEMEDLVMFIGGGHLISAHTNFIMVDTPAVLLKM